MMRRLPVLMVAVGAAALSACGGTRIDKAPGITDVTSALTTQVLANGTSRFASVDHVAVKSIKPDENATYTTNVHFETVFNKGLTEIVHELESAGQPGSASEAQGRQKLIYGLMALKLQFGNFGAGLRVPRDVTASLRRDKGGTWDLTILPHAPAARLAAGPPAPMVVVENTNVERRGHR